MKINLLIIAGVISSIVGYVFLVSTLAGGLYLFSIPPSLMVMLGIITIYFGYNENKAFNKRRVKTNTREEKE